MQLASQRIVVPNRAFIGANPSNPPSITCYRMTFLLEEVSDELTLMN